MLIFQLVFLNVTETQVFLFFLFTQKVKNTVNKVKLHTVKLQFLCTVVLSGSVCLYIYI